jgi:membrane-associated protease RseP (regulator of RpoE activity)
VQLHVVPRGLAEWLVVDLPLVVAPRLCFYVIAVSAGVAFLNVLPIWAFDGAHVLNVLLIVVPTACCRRLRVKDFLDAGVDEDDAVTLAPRLGWRAMWLRRILNAGTAAFVLNTFLSVAVVMVAGVV